jgi:hypothetical protein
MDGLHGVSPESERCLSGDYLRPAYAQVSCAHAVHLRCQLYTVKVQHYRAKGGIVRIRQGINERMHRVSPHSIIINTRSVDELAVKLPGKDRIWQLTEELLQQPSYTVDIVLEGFGVSEVDL